MPQVQISVTNTATAYWIAVDDQDITLVGGQATLNLAAGEHTMSWWMLGAPGTGLVIKATEAARILVDVTDKVPAGSGREAGMKWFQV